jgi:hypothetical protein
MFPLLISSSTLPGFNRVLSSGIPELASEPIISND